MRELVGKHRNDELRIFQEYADAERRGIVRRKSNKYNMTAEEYARRLYNDGVKKGWL